MPLDPPPNYPGGMWHRWWYGSEAIPYQKPEMAMDEDITGLATVCPSTRNGKPNSGSPRLKLTRRSVDEALPHPFCAPDEVRKQRLTRSNRHEEMALWRYVAYLEKKRPPEWCQLLKELKA